MKIKTRADALRLIRRAETRAALLRQAGFSNLSLEERRRIADETDALCALLRRALGDVKARMPASVLGDDDPSHADEMDERDLFGSAA